MKVGLIVFFVISWGSSIIKGQGAPNTPEPNQTTIPGNGNFTTPNPTDIFFPITKCFLCKFITDGLQHLVTKENSTELIEKALEKACGFLGKGKGNFNGNGNENGNWTGNGDGNGNGNGNGNFPLTNRDGHGNGNGNGNNSGNGNGFLPFRRDECDRFIKDWTPTILVHIDNGIKSPEKICELIGFCTGTGFAPPFNPLDNPMPLIGPPVKFESSYTDHCFVCNYVGSSVYTSLYQNPYRTQKKTFLTPPCTYLPPILAAVCQDIINFYIEPITHLIYYGYETNEVCQMVGICPDGYLSKNESCPSILTKNGVNSSTFLRAAGHGIHSITVNDIRFYFDKNFPEVNNIPTVNPNFTSEIQVFPFAPLGSDFLTPGMRVLDNILSNDDDSDTFLLRGVNRMTKIAHGLHMNDVWQKASLAYKLLKKTPPSSYLCPCLNNDEDTGLMEHLKSWSDMLRGTDNGTGNGNEDRILPLTERGKNSSLEAYIFWIYNFENAPVLEDQVSWEWWKDGMKSSMLDKNEIRHLALYLHCKIWLTYSPEKVTELVEDMK